MAEHLKIMTLNLHTYQELNSENFRSLDDFFEAYANVNEIIADTIKEKDLDIIFLQEAAQHKDMPVVMGNGNTNIKKYNVILELQKLLKEKYKLGYNFIWDWSHYGWDVWEEGIGILTRFDIKKMQSCYVSSKTDKNDIFSRKVVKGVLSLPKKDLDVYSAHLNWWEKGFKEDIDNLFKWIEESDASSNFVLAGDFNNAAGGTGYNYLMTKTINGQKIIDVDFKASSDNFNRATIRGDAFNSTQRIDYIITSDKKDTKVIKSECIFATDEDRVSDHMGIIAEIEI
ncbi:endonuclease/exonuclease/phosphatase family protein [Clostridiales bacterium oral taxon 876 str. F0540]|nr:endonuclease/exonuclease/phosphatase family protein [Clostridiales bacterium oral taxon 876 str. F0540]